MSSEGPNGKPFFCEHYRLNKIILKTLVTGALILGGSPLVTGPHHVNLYYLKMHHLFSEAHNFQSLRATVECQGPRHNPHKEIVTDFLPY